LCHLPHGSNEAFLLAGRASELCIDCHPAPPRPMATARSAIMLTAMGSPISSFVNNPTSASPATK
jgi:predicted CXXCH cytochrome family protein